MDNATNDAYAEFYKENFENLLKDISLLYFYIKEKIEKTSPEIQINDEIGSIKGIKNMVDKLCETVVDERKLREESISELAAKRMLYDAALDEICRLKLK